MYIILTVTFTEYINLYNWLDIQQYHAMVMLYLFYKKKKRSYFIERLLQLSENDSLESLEKLGKLRNCS